MRPPAYRYGCCGGREGGGQTLSLRAKPERALPWRETGHQVCSEQAESLEAGDAVSADYEVVVHFDANGVRPVVEWLMALGRTGLDVINVGCGAGWLEPTLMQFGNVTGTDLSESVLVRAQERTPEARFVAGDFMALDFGAAKYDVVVTLEMLSHIADQKAFVAKLAHLLKPGGTLIMATQNRPVLQNHNNIPPPEPGQLRKWVDRQELEALLSEQFEVREIRTMTPSASKGLMRLVAGRRVKQLLRAVIGRVVERQLAAAGFGWTLMALARKPAV